MTHTPSIQRITGREDFLATIENRSHYGNVPAALALTDVDDFAEINTRHGHEVGDEVLRSWERVVEANLPADATLTRLGGDEYAVLLPGSSAENALVLLDEIRAHFTARPVGAAGQVTVSVGVASIPPHGTTAEELWRASGEALMRAKRDGRDRIAIYVEEKMVMKSNYYSRANLERLAKLSDATARTEASLLREALDDLLAKYGDRL